MLAFIAYIFAGAEQSSFNDLNFDALEILAKLAVTTSTVLGSITLSNDVETFCLLDIDASCGPNDARGTVRHASSYFSKMLPINEHGEELANWAVIVSDDGDDYSVHIEPDWDHDTQTSVVACRHQGSGPASVTRIDRPSVWVDVFSR
jgi:hypothetical protein